MQASTTRDRRENHKHRRYLRKYYRMVKENSKHKKTLKMKHLKSPEKYETTKSKK
jgi:hypothetical protein